MPERHTSAQEKEKVSAAGIGLRMSQQVVLPLMELEFKGSGVSTTPKSLFMSESTERKRRQCKRRHCSDERRAAIERQHLSDKGPQFIARDFKSFVRIQGLTHVRTSPYYPQSNGK